MYTPAEEHYLLALARNSIYSYLMRQSESASDTKSLPSKRFAEERACFVTLTIDGNLRGCIGHILPVQELYKDVIENAEAAAFQDPRFAPVRKEELGRINIEISVLTVPQVLKYASSDDLIAKLRPGIHGVILKKGRCQATFLPQVWEELSGPQEFLSHLCLKAGLSADAWQSGSLEIETYQVEAFEDKCRF